MVLVMPETNAANQNSMLGNVRFENIRFDPDLTPFHQLAKDMAAQFGYSANLSGDRSLLQLLRLRVAQLNPCSYCLILHAAVAARIGIASEQAAHLASWRESSMFSPAERAALAYCEGLTRSVTCRSLPCTTSCGCTSPSATSQRSPRSSST